MWSVEMISAERPMHHPRQSNVAETKVQTACPHTDRRRGAQPVQLSYYFQKASTITVIYTKRHRHMEASIQKHITNNYIKFIKTTKKYMNPPEIVNKYNDY